MRNEIPNAPDLRSGASPVSRALRFGALIAPLLFCSCAFWTPRSMSAGPAAVVVSEGALQRWSITSCGAGALSAVLQHYGDSTTMSQWEQTLPKTHGGVMSVDLLIAAREKGFDARIVNGDADFLAGELSQRRPVIAMLRVIQSPGVRYDFFHYVVVDGYDKDRKLFRMQFGDGKARWVSLDRIETAWAATKHAAIAIQPRDPIAESIRAAVRLEESGDDSAAIDAYRTILASHPQSSLAWTNLGNVQMRIAMREDAEQSFHRAIEIDPSSADALNNLAWLLFEEQRYQEAEPIARKAVAATAPDRWTRLDTLGRILVAKGSCADAESVFREALAEVPEARKSEREGIEAAARSCGG